MIASLVEDFFSPSDKAFLFYKSIKNDPFFVDRFLPSPFLFMALSLYQVLQRAGLQVHSF